MAFKDIRKSRRLLSAEETWFLALTLILLFGLLMANIYMARTLPGGEWFFQRWSGLRAFLALRADLSTEGLKGARTMPDAVSVTLAEGTHPYSSEIARRTQQVAYGRPAFSSEYSYVLNDPFHVLMLYLPLAFIKDFTLARGLWALLCEAVLVGTLVLALNLSEWQPPRWLYALLIMFGLSSLFSLTSLVTGSPAIILAFLYLCILVALRSYSDELAGILLALAAYQWEVGGLLVLYFIFFAFANRRWGVLAGIAMSLFVLLVISFMVYPGWGLPYIRAVISAWLRGANFSLGHIVSVWFPEARFSIAGILAIVLGIMLFVEWVTSVNAHFRRVVWTASLSIAATPLMGLAIFPSNHVALLFPFILILSLVWERWQRRRVLYTLLVFLLVLSVPFGIYLRTVYVYDPLMTDLVAVIPPAAAVAGLYWMRWWVLRPPRTWFDRLGEYR